MSSLNVRIVEREAITASPGGPAALVAPASSPATTQSPRRARDNRFPAAGRVVCGLIAAIFAIGVYLTPNLTELFFVRAIFMLGVFVYGQLAVMGRLGRRRPAP